VNFDFLSWAASADGEIRLEGREVLTRLGSVRIPVLFFAGAADRLAPPDSVRRAFDAWGAAAPAVEKSFVVLGLRQGAQADYGHGDLAIGRHARREIYEPIAEFLAMAGACGASRAA
jgi:pimeloyl-ACP methyl ester carboxylesterase